MSSIDSLISSLENQLIDARIDAAKKKLTSGKSWASIRASETKKIYNLLERITGLNILKVAPKTQIFYDVEVLQFEKEIYGKVFRFEVKAEKGLGKRVIDLFQVAGHQGMGIELKSASTLIKNIKGGLSAEEIDAIFRSTSEIQKQISLEEKIFQYAKDNHLKVVFKGKDVLGNIQMESVVYPEYIHNTRIIPYRSIPDKLLSPTIVPSFNPPKRFTQIDSSTDSKATSIPRDQPSSRLTGTGSRAISHTSTDELINNGRVTVKLNKKEMKAVVERVDLGIVLKPEKEVFLEADIKPIRKAIVSMGINVAASVLADYSKGKLEQHLISLVNNARNRFRNRFPPFQRVWEVMFLPDYENFIFVYNQITTVAFEERLTKEKLLENIKPYIEEADDYIERFEIEIENFIKKEINEIKKISQYVESRRVICNEIANILMKNIESLSMLYYVCLELWGIKEIFENIRNELQDFKDEIYNKISEYDLIRSKEYKFIRDKIYNMYETIQDMQRFLEKR